MPPPAEDEFYHDDLVGLEAVTREGEPLGRVVGLQQFRSRRHSGNRAAEGEDTFYLPFTKAVAVEIDFSRGRIVIVPPYQIDGEEPELGVSFAATILTLFPEMFPGPLGLSLAGDALARGLWSCATVDIRAHGLGRHRAVDDTPAGGGPGMVMRADVLAASLDAALEAGDPAAAAVDEPARPTFDSGQGARVGDRAGPRDHLRAF